MNILRKLFLSSKKNTPVPASENEFERCVSCGKLTDIPCSAPIEQRTHYVSGCGQLCPECYGKLYSSFDGGELLDSELDASVLLRRRRRKNSKHKDTIHK